MSSFVSVAKVSELLPGHSKAVQVAGKTIALHRGADGICATDNVCPHKGGPLAEGALNDNVVTCPWHGWRFDVKTGKNPEGMPIQIQCYEVKVEGDEIQVAIPS